MCDWLKLLIFSNLLIIHSFGRAVGSHSVGGCSPPFFFLMSFMKGNWNCCFLSETFNDTTIVFLNSEQYYSSVMEWVLTSQHNSAVLNVTPKLAQGSSYVWRI